MTHADTSSKPRITGFQFFRQLNLRGLHRTTKQLLRELAFRTWWEGREAGFSSRGIERLAVELDMSIATVKRHLDRLERAGLIKRHRKGCCKGGRLRDRIELVGFVSWVRRNTPVVTKLYTYCRSVLNRVQGPAREGGVSAHFDPFAIKDRYYTGRESPQGARKWAYRVEVMAEGGAQ